MIERVLAAQLIRYQAPQYLVEPVGPASDRGDVISINAATWDTIDATVDWEPYNAIIRVWDNTGCISQTYLALVA